MTSVSEEMAQRKAPPQPLSVDAPCGDAETSACEHLWGASRAVQSGSLPEGCCLEKSVKSQVSFEIRAVINLTIFPRKLLEVNNNGYRSVLLQIQYMQSALPDTSNQSVPAHQLFITLPGMLPKYFFRHCDIVHVPIHLSCNSRDVRCPNKKWRGQRWSDGVSA